MILTYKEKIMNEYFADIPVGTKVVWDDYIKKIILYIDDRYVTNTFALYRKEDDYYSDCRYQIDVKHIDEFDEGHDHSHDCWIATAGIEYERSVDSELSKNRFVFIFFDNKNDFAKYKLLHC